MVIVNENLQEVCTFMELESKWWNIIKHRWRITSTVSANTTAGFSIVSYTGTWCKCNSRSWFITKPDLIIVKKRDTSKHWQVVYHKAIGATKYILFKYKLMLKQSATGIN